MNLKKFMLACIAGLTSFSVMAVGPLVLDAGTNQLVASWSEDLPLQGLGDVTGWSYKASGGTEFLQLASGMDDASVVKSTTKLDLNTSGGELKMAFGSAPLTIPTSGAYEYSVDTTFQFTKDWPTDLLGELQTSGAKTAVFAMANNADDDSEGAKLIIAQGGAYAETGVSSAAGFAYVQLPAPIATGTSYRVTIRVKGAEDDVVYGQILGYPVTLIKVLVDGVEYPVFNYDSVNGIGSQIGFSGEESDLTVMGDGTNGNWVMAACFNADYVATLSGTDGINSVSFQGTGTLDNMALATYSDAPAASWTLGVVGDGVVNDSNSQPVSGVLGAGTYTVVPGEGFILGSIASSASTGFSVDGNTFTLDAATALDTVTVTFKAVTEAPVASDIANIPEGQLDTTAKGTLNAAIAGVTDGSTKFDAWATAKSVTVADLTTAGIDNVINAFLCNVALDETDGLLQVSALTIENGNFVAIVNTGAITITDGVLMINGTAAALVGDSLSNLSPATSFTVLDNQDGTATITVELPAGTAGFLKMSIQ